MKRDVLNLVNPLILSRKDNRDWPQTVMKALSRIRVAKMNDCHRLFLDVVTRCDSSSTLYLALSHLTSHWPLEWISSMFVRCPGYSGIRRYECSSRGLCIIGGELRATFEQRSSAGSNGPSMLFTVLQTLPI